VPGKAQLVRVKHGYDEHGAVVTPVGGHGSHLIGDLAQADALVVVPEETEALQFGDQVDVLLLDREY
jgi:molybdopterin molybdotransferase